MPDAAHVSLQKAIVSELTTGTWSLTFSARRVLDPMTELVDLEALTVAVVPAKIATDHLTRGKLQDTPEIDIGIMKHLAPGDYLTEADALAYLAQEIADHFTRLHIASLAATCTATATVPGAEPGYAPARLRSERTFTAVVRTTWEMDRAITG